MKESYIRGSNRLIRKEVKDYNEIRSERKIINTDYNQWLFDVKIYENPWYYFLVNQNHNQWLLYTGYWNQCKIIFHIIYDFCISVINYNNSKIKSKLSKFL